MSGTARGSYNFRIQAEGFAEFIQDLQKVAGESEAAQQVIGTLIQASPQLASAMTTATEAMERAARNATAMREAQDRAVASTQSLVPATRTAAQALEGFEGRTLAARRGLNDLRGAIELVGLGNLASALGPVSGALGNAADAFSVAAVASRGATSAIGLVIPGFAAVTAAVTAGVVVWQNWDAIANTARNTARGLGEELGILARQHELGDTALQGSARWFDAYAAALRRARGEVEDLAQAEFNRLRTDNFRQGQALYVERSRFMDALGPASERLTAAEVERAGILSDLGGTLNDTARDGRRARLDVLNRQVREAEAEANRLRAEVERRDAEMRRLQDGLAELTIQGPGLFRAPSRNDPYSAPSTPSRVGGGRAGASPGRDYDQHIVAREASLEAQVRAEERAREQVARGELRALEQRQRANERTTDSIVRYTADRFTDLFTDNTNGWARMLESFRQLAISTPIRIGVDALIRPVVTAGVDAVTSAVGGNGGISNMLGLGQLFGGGGITGAINGLGVSSGLFGNGVTFAANSGAASYGGFGLAGEGATSGLLGAGTAMQALGGIGGGFALGSMLSSLTAGNSRARQTNGMLGAGGGALLGVGLAGVTGGLSLLAGGLLGGAGGGLLGGLIGPGKGFEGGDALVSFGPNGELVVSGYQGKNFAQEAELMAAARAQVAQMNAGLSATGLSFAGRTADGNFATAIGGGESSNSTNIAGALTASGFGAGSLVSGNANVRTALAAQSGASVTDAIETAAWVQQTYELLAGIKVPAQGFAAALEAVDTNFGTAIARAKELQLATDGLVAAQQKQVAEILATQNRQIGNVQGGITSRWFRAVGMDAEAALNDFDLGAAQQIADLRTSLEALGVTAGDVNVQVGRLAETQALERRNLASASTAVDGSGAASARQLLESLTVGGLGGLSPGARAVAARRNIEAARAAFGDGATSAEIAEFSRVVQAGLPVIQQSEGITTGLSSLVASITDTLRQVAPGADVANLAGVIDATRAGATQVEAAIDRWGGRVETLARELMTLTEQVRVLAAR